MYKITVQGKQSLFGKEIPVLLGGFGEKQTILTDKWIAEIHYTQVKRIRENVSRNIERFIENIDIINLKNTVADSDQDNILIDIGYSKTDILKSKNLYIFSRRGYLKLVKIMNTDKAWEVYEEMLDKYFIMEKYIKEDSTNIDKDISELKKQVNNLVEQNKSILSTFKKQPDRECIITSGEWCYEQYCYIKSYLYQTQVLPIEESYIVLKQIYDLMYFKDNIIIEDYDVKMCGSEKASKIKIISQHKELRDIFEKHLTEIFQQTDNTEDNKEKLYYIEEGLELIPRRYI